MELAAYNWGPGNLERNPETLPKQTKDFFARVQERYLGFRNSPLRLVRVTVFQEFLSLRILGW
jgi:hypothetical protein